MAATLWSAVMFLGVSLLLVLVSLPLFFLLYLYHVHKVYDHIPGPKRNHFVWGHLKEIERIQREGSSSTFDKYLEYAIEYGPVMLIWFLHKPIVIVTSPELVKEVTVIANLPKDPWVYKNSIGFPLGERLMGRALPCAIDHTAWQRRRSTLNPAFHKTFLKELIPQFNSCCDVFLAKLSRLADGKTEVVMLEEFNRATLDVIGKVAFGLDLNAINEPDSPFPQALQEAFSVTMWVLSHPLHAVQFSTYGYQEQAISAIHFLRDFAKKTIDERKRAIQDGEDVPGDILSYILKMAQQDQSISMEDIIDEFTGLLFAGQDTTASMLSYLLVEVGQQQQVEERLIEEAEEVLGSRQYVTFEDLSKLHYTGLTIKETLRVHPSVPLASRVMPKDGHLGGYFIPGGTSVTFGSYLMHRHPKYWDDPLVFRPERFDESSREGINHYAYFPFSIGPRNCIGQTFAQFESKVLLSRFLSSFKFKLVPGQSFQADEPRSTLAPIDGARCTLTLR